VTERGRLRIIGGEWRGRKLSFPALPGLRPTSDRVRETLFNWLRDVVPGARCLDLFAGSGALGFEALSRGAEFVTMVDQNPAVVTEITTHIHTLKAANARVTQADALTFLQGPPSPYDIVFLDPPFQSRLLEPCLALLAERGWLAPSAWLYIEADRRTPLPSMAPDWTLLRSKQAGQVGYYLLQRISSISGAQGDST
jgi:16S rRNA (guanine966-N2)-methyltransferase